MGAILAPLLRSFPFSSVPVDEEGKGIAGGAAANQAGRRAISAAWVIDGDTHCPVFLPRRRPVPASSWSSPSDTAKIACDLRLPSRRTFIFASLTPSIPSQV
uniref:Uncharacterized protein n=2 Tax=Oryza TaxID=4527 RepID=A0A1V1H1D9_ORYRU|nr:hypothetical protein [Oryza sativa Indica Group]BAX24738.1 hypothetical protein [Oryza rufipogon]